MPSVQEQESDFAGAYSICGQATLPGAGIDEHCGSDVYQAIRSVDSLDEH